MKRLMLFLGVAAAFIGANGAAFAEGDAALGKNVFKKCMACHDAVTEKNKVGPQLVGIVGRKAGAAADFKYSEALIAKGADGFLWTEENLTTYLKNPKDFIPGIKMAFSGLKKDEDIVNLLAYLKADPKP